MTSITRIHEAGGKPFVAGNSGVVLGSIATLLLVLLGSVLWAPAGLILAVFALVAASLAALAGMALRFSSGRRRSGLLMAAGLFACAAAAAAILGDPNQVALLQAP